MTEAHVDPELEEFAQQIADAVESFLVTLRALSREENPGTVVPLLLVEVSQILFAGARLGAQRDFAPTLEYQPDVGPDPDLDAMRLRLARLLDSVDTYTFNFDPYVPEITTAQLSDDLTSIATDLANGLRHFRAGDVVRGAVVVAVLLRRHLGQQRQRGAPGAAVRGGPRPPGRRLRERERPDRRRRGRAGQRRDRPLSPRRIGSAAHADRQAGPSR